MNFDVVRKRKKVREARSEFLEAKAASGVKSASDARRQTTYCRLVPFLTDETTFDDTTEKFAYALRDRLSETYSRSTLSTKFADFRAFAKRHVEKGYVESAPFSLIPKGTTANKERDFQVPAERTERILAARSNQTARTLRAMASRRAETPRTAFVASRFGRPEIETIKSLPTKTERFKSGGLRDVPISATLARELETQLASVPAEDEFIVKEFAFDQVFSRVFKRAGLTKWTKLFQNLRSSCENDGIAAGIPARVAAARTERSAKTREARHLRVLPEYFQRVTGL